MKKALFLVLIALTISMHIPSPALAERVSLRIGTGGVTGIYYPTGQNIARLINRLERFTGPDGHLWPISATAELTGGSSANINAVLGGQLELGLAQSDRQYQAVNGLAEWEGDPRQDLRAVFSLYPEALTLCASVSSGIRGILDLKGKRVNIGNMGSGHRQNAIDVLTAVGLDWEKDLHAEQVEAAESPSLLQDGRIDAFFYTVGHPNGNIREATAGAVQVVIVPIEAPGVDQLVGRLPYYTKAVIQAAVHYPKAANRTDVPTIGVKATLIAAESLPEETVYQVVKAVFDHLEEFKGMHPAYALLTKEGMLEGLSAPLHPGAEKYFKEIGLLK